MLRLSLCFSGLLLAKVENKVLVLLPGGPKELSIGSSVEAKAPEEKISRNGFRKGRQAAKMAKLSCRVVAK